MAVAVHGLAAREGETSFALVVLKFSRALDRARIVRILGRLAPLLPDYDAVVADLPDELPGEDGSMRIIAVPWAPPEPGSSLDAQRALVTADTADGLEAAWFFQTGTSLPLEDDDEDDDDEDDDEDDQDGDDVDLSIGDRTAPITLEEQDRLAAVDFDFGDDELDAAVESTASSPPVAVADDDDDDDDDGDGDDDDADGDDDDDDDSEVEDVAWSHGPPPQLAEAPFPVDGYPEILESLDWEDFGLALKLSSAWTSGESLVLRGFHALWLAPYAMRYRNSDVTIDITHHAVHLWVDRFAAPTPPEEQVHHLLWVAAQLHQVLPVVHARFVGATMAQKFGELVGDDREPFVLGGNPLLAIHARGGEAAIDEFLATQHEWSPEELAKMLDELAVEIVTADPPGPAPDTTLATKPAKPPAKPQKTKREPRHIATYAADLLAARAHAGAHDTRTAIALRPILDVPEKYEHRRRAAVDVLGAIKDRQAVRSMIKILDDNPIKGSLDSIGKEQFLASTANALGAIGDAAAIPALARVAAAKGAFNDKPRTWAANALARCLAARAGSADIPRDIDDAVLATLLETIAERNDGPLNAHAHLSYARLARLLPAPRRAVAARTLADAPTYRDDATPALARRAAIAIASPDPLPAGHADALRDLLHRALAGRSWDHDATVRDLAIALMIGDLLPDLVDPADLVRLTRFSEGAVRTAAHELAAKLGKPVAPAMRFDRGSAHALTDAELARWLDEPHVIGLGALVGEAGTRGAGSLRPAILRLAHAAIAAAPDTSDLLEPHARVLAAAVAALRTGKLDAPALALFDAMLRHTNHNVKWALLKDPPADARLADGMVHVLGERWGWQERAAREWLARHAPDRVGDRPADDDDDDDGDDDDDDGDMN